MSCISASITGLGARNKKETGSLTPLSRLSCRVCYYKFIMVSRHALPNQFQRLSVTKFNRTVAQSHGNRYKMVACGGARIARLYVNGSGALYLEWVRNLNGGGEYTTAVWVDCNFDYWIG